MGERYSEWLLIFRMQKIRGKSPLFLLQRT